MADNSTNRPGSQFINVGDFRCLVVLSVPSVPTSIGGDRESTKEQDNMMNLVEKYTAEAPAATEKMASSPSSTC